jgi:transcriptional regulator with XRE-family HTH domain
MVVVMQSHAAILPKQADEITDPRSRLVLLCHSAGASYTEIERMCGLARGAISNYVGGRSYAYPRIREAVTTYLAVALDVDEAELHAYLFPDEDTS